MKLNHKYLLLGIASVVTVAACTTPVINPVSSMSTVTPSESTAVFPGIFPARNLASDQDGPFFKEYNALNVIDKIEKLFHEHLVLTMTWVRSNPIQLFAELRAKKPVLVLEAIPIKNAAHPNVDTVLVTKGKDVIEILNQPTIFSVADYHRKINDSVGEFMLASDQKPVNEEKPWMREMMPREDQPKIKKMVRELVDQAIREGTFVRTRPDGTSYAGLEVVNSLARRVPILLTGKYFGFPGPSEQKMATWSHATQDDFFHNVKNEAAVHNRAVLAGVEMHKYLRELMEQKRGLLSQDPSKDDVLTRMLRNGHSEIGTDEKIRRNIMGTLVGGVETTEAAVVQSLRVMMTHPQIFAAAQKAALSGNDALLANFVWEALRFDPVNPFVVRMAEQDYTLRGVLIKKGSLVLVATQSAMFDEELVDHPTDFKLGRPDSVYFHLGYGHHRCLGDYVSLVQVPEIVKGVLTQPGLRLASGQAGEIIKTPGSSSFPESFVVEYNVDKRFNSPRLAGTSPDFAFEEYLQDYDRHEFRMCLRGVDDRNLSRVSSNIERHYKQDFHKRLFYCRLKSSFRNCIEKQTDAGTGLEKFMVWELSKAQEEAMVICSKDLTPVEETFYRSIMLNQPFDITKVSTAQAHRNSGPDYEFEDHIKFYDRYRYAECFMSPFAPKALPNDRDQIFYARLPMAFRDCIGKPVLANRLSKGLIGKTREVQFPICKNGTPNPMSGVLEGALSIEEIYYYRKLILKEDVTYTQVEKEESK